jgi:hypothetical protein
MLARARCFNHDLRQASGLCATCSRSYCRECLTEHSGRLTCSFCLRRPAAAGKPGHSFLSGVRRKLIIPAMAVAAFFGASLLFYSLGITLELMTEPPGGQQSQGSQAAR